MSTVQKKTVLERITINNILAFMIVGAYVGMWTFIMWFGTTQALAPTQTDDPIIVVLSTIEAFVTVITTMTIIVVLVVQYHFRTSPPLSFA
jgi:hypothetical protein